MMIAVVAAGTDNIGMMMVVIAAGQIATGTNKNGVVAIGMMVVVIAAGTTGGRQTVGTTKVGVEAAGLSGRG